MSDVGRPRCPQYQVGSGRQCIRPENHPGDCAASWGSRVADFGTWKPCGCALDECRGADTGERCRDREPVAHSELLVQEA